MRLTKIIPRGFCKGVVDAYVTTKDIASKSKGKDIYMIGWLVHNNHIIDELESLGVKIIDDSKKDRAQIIRNIANPEKSIVIFSAHGTDQKAIDLAKERKIEYFDLTCEYVYKTHKIIKENLKKNKTILFIGKKGHPETIAILALSNKITLIETLDDAKKIDLPIDENLFLTNQTTISIYDFFSIVTYLRKKFTNITFKNDICNATKERQEAIKNMDKSIDLLIIVGDKKSSNSNKLVEIGKSQNVESYLVSDSSDIQWEWFQNKKHVGVSSGCSTPTYATNGVIITINNKMLENEY
ncbi:MAG: 4-hydroxy-3-methylbut-2-enyl diphosphate reductase [Malacoplasma sp.]